MTNVQAFEKYFDAVIDYWKDDAKSKGQRMPQDFKKVINEHHAEIIPPKHFKYLVFGRPPGKQPPTDVIEKWLRRAGIRPENNRDSKGRFIKLNYRSLAFIIARKIGEEGSMIYRGDKPGIDYVGGLEKFRPELLKTLAYNQAMDIKTHIGKNFTSITTK